LCGGEKRTCEHVHILPADPTTILSLALLDGDLLHCRALGCLSRQLGDGQRQHTVCGGGVPLTIQVSVLHSGGQKRGATAQQ
jgi:hypothetical protein